MKKKLKIPPEIAAQVLFLSDRSCCMCRTRTSFPEIHHIDGDPSNYDLTNLAILCKDHHTETQIKGGFFRKLDSHQVTLYRDNWLSTVAMKRAIGIQTKIEIKQESTKGKTYDSIVEFYKEIKDYRLLVFHYDSIGNVELRDKYIDEILKKPTDEAIVFFRGLQNKTNLIPKEVIQRIVKEKKKEKDWFNIARTYATIGNYKLATENYVKGLSHGLKRGSLFTVAFYIKELVEDGIVNELFEMELKSSRNKKDIWWQMRCLEELDRREEAIELLLENKESIKKSDDLHLKIQLALAEKNDEEYHKLLKKDAEKNHHM